MGIAVLVGVWIIIHNLLFSIWVVKKCSQNIIDKIYFESIKVIERTKELI